MSHQEYPVGRLEAELGGRTARTLVVHELKTDPAS
jgi:hypothetical protein